ncbi:peptide chain release factor N(5)-glutamine methyltransferase [Flavihumibacter rivuli]|uniref:peptide chain release factor N(5)-glutamine methyltransferase n=1 Tax=Flavihumibacter rivuli TaxID=2838156 RepID=UPI001BDDEBE3|nr:peptide chain release factor N(5)-glutamine methyltransferase [Flavihumibacter rivuli]ULQ56701.1 peptide chain release factor N(5)-glutamine methyltransferase [Flavihumibacter rivuli]
MNIKEAYDQLRFSLDKIYPEKESMLITGMLMEKITGLTEMDMRKNASKALTNPQIIRFQTWQSELTNHRPIQYVLNEAWFWKYPFKVDERVLIPRPETEELVEWVIKDEKGAHPNPCILDIGTGSGCIPITLSLELPNARVHTCDISEGAIALATENASSLGANISFHHLDFLDNASWGQLPRPDIIISNPPYIPKAESHQMDPHVVKFEPGIALFVPDNDAVVFYAAIAGFAMQNVKPGARIYVEIHENLAGQVREAFETAGLVDIQTRKDLQGKDRMIKALCPK